MAVSRNLAQVLEAGYFPTSQAKTRTPDNSGTSSGDEDSTRRSKRRPTPLDSVNGESASTSTSTTGGLPPLAPSGFSSESSSTVSMPPYSTSETTPSRRQTFEDPQNTLEQMQSSSLRGNARAGDAAMGNKIGGVRVRPPSPHVEGELESLARELVDALPSLDEVPNKGDVEQMPILVEVHEHNPERRFVLVTPNDGDIKSERPSPTNPSPDMRDRGEANTARNHDPYRAAAAAAAAAAASVAARKSGSGSGTGACGSRPPPTSPCMFNERGEPVKRTRVRSQSSAQNEQQPKDTSSKRTLPPVDTARHDNGRAPNGCSPTSLRTPTTCDPQQRPRSMHCDRKRSDEANLLSPQAAPRSRSTAESPRTDRVSETAAGGYAEPARPLYRANSLYMRSSRAREPRRSSPPRDDDLPSDQGRALRAPAILVRKSDLREGEDEFVDPDDVVPMPAMVSMRSRGRTPTSPSSRAPYPDDIGASPHHSMPILPVPEGDRVRRDDPPYPLDEEPPRGGRSPAESTRTRSRSLAQTMRVSTGFISAPAAAAAPPSPRGSSADLRRSTQTASASGPRSPTTSSSLEGDRSNWQPGAFDLDQNRNRLNRPPGAYRRYSEDVSQTRLPECRRTKPVAGKKDWMTLEQCTNFNICPTCYGGLFSHTSFSDDFVPAARPLDVAISCDFGSIPWYRIAWLLTLKNRRNDLVPFHRITTTFKNAVLKGEACPGDRAATRTWYSIAYPKGGQLIPNFDICYTCASSIELLLPQLKGVFVPVEPSKPTRGTCAMHFAEDRKRFVSYFDAMESIADRAAANNGGVAGDHDVTQLATALDRLSSFVECREGAPIINGGWHEMCDLPDVTVCGECFDEVVRPQLELNNAVARKFFLKARRRAAPTTCQLYSPRMRDVFRKACRKADLGYLEARVRERREVEQSIRGNLDRLRRDADRERQRGRDRDADRLEERVEQLIKEWRKWK